ncbi:hypothetical protein GCM10010404_92860 [Nonomuraea africana]|uniref:NERD domain-containing protein n=1 Tax=Nonomuraea africana TaxID=46171 RepID=A0ABR9KCS3_9ACTN|nr:nuclease-related domain-containing protein [Nonomuraea africana]MBE1559823.1 hypothetical protein [Nonomuraea africana]
MTVPRPDRAGASAEAHYRAQLAATRSRRLAARTVLALVAGAAAWWLLGWQAALIAAALAAAADAVRQWRTHSSVAAWRKGAAGERATARLLRSLELAGYTVLHDRRLPRGRANVDHLVIGPTGIFCVDSKRWDRRTQIHGRGGTLFIGRQPAAKVVRPLEYEARAVTQVLRQATGRAVEVGAVVAVHGAKMPRWRTLTVNGIPLLRARQLHRWIIRHPPRFDAAEVAKLAAVCDRALPPYIAHENP